MAARANDSASSEADRILLRDIRFYGNHGATVEEQDVGQWYAVDLDLYLDLAAAGGSDDLSKTVDYGEVCRMVMEFGSTRRFRLIEALAEEISSGVLNNFAVDSVRIRVTKSTPAGLIASLSGLGTLGYSAVEVHRSRAAQ
ncbi:dihydroneopterin aldolase [Candidatus Poribacteria bacterium]|jgi:7,8-dihydroneopterin aldolase/epimerase/oxygenase|nr:dihydroneopterin aldolase [Candidatus Poribacteria bacterium]MBT5534995.1 dihydroneopterin aldolase [Candidatus Poribacteria bacterium]MBT5713880.1 dihydroneopterin aldolase [Candidatus Poribacteria bacterium]MBT7100336.1 dihydroneopterin aldolase [Candidatus Poribacteria bacterium]MBT7809534.1 dihydroneopterin aldolase [Candidatus Poribacteria bacterium]